MRPHSFSDGVNVWKLDDHVLSNVIPDVRDSIEPTNEPPEVSRAIQDFRNSIWPPDVFFDTSIPLDVTEVIVSERQ